MRRSTPSCSSCRLTCTDTVRCSGAMGGDRPSLSALIKLVFPTCSSCWAQWPIPARAHNSYHLRANDHDAAAAGGEGASLKHCFHKSDNAVCSACDDFRRRHGQAVPAVACHTRAPVAAVEPQTVGIAAAAHERRGSGKIEGATLLVSLARSQNTRARHVASCADAAAT